jgi:hypothetical protein
MPLQLTNVVLDNAHASLDTARNLHRSRPRSRADYLAATPSADPGVVIVGGFPTPADGRTISLSQVKEMRAGRAKRHRWNAEALRRGAEDWLAGSRASCGRAP